MILRIKMVLLPVLSLRGNYGIDNPCRVGCLGLGSSGLLVAATLLFLRRDHILERGQVDKRFLFLTVGLLGLKGVNLGYRFFSSIYTSKYKKYVVAQRLLDMVYDWAHVVKVADIGCGRGLLTAAIANHLAKLRLSNKNPEDTYQITCVDTFSYTKDPLSSNQLRFKFLENLKKDHVDLAHINLHDSLLTTIMLPSNTYDLVVSSLAISEVGYSKNEGRQMSFKTDLTSQQQQQLALAEIVRITKPGGQFLIWDVECAQSYAEFLTVHTDVINIYTSAPFRMFDGKKYYIVAGRKALSSP